ncbi:MAG TPA: hypothetical protein DCQ06_11950, partial [Myxococcales bacterium]|nr:hypothetical protein [Myxococcales bacterium]
PWLLQPATRWVRKIGRSVTIEQARAENAALGEIVRNWWGDADVVLTPTVGVDPPRAGEFKALDPPDLFKRMGTIGAFTAPFNISGQPSASIPAGFSNAGLPVGALLTTRHGQDATLFQLCTELEKALNWRRRRCSMASSCSP